MALQETFRSYQSEPCENVTDKLGEIDKCVCPHEPAEGFTTFVVHQRDGCGRKQCNRTKLDGYAVEAILERGANEDTSQSDCDEPKFRANRQDHGSEINHLISLPP